MNSSQPRRMIAAGMIGNVLEWYDFAIYGYFATFATQLWFRETYRTPFVGSSSGTAAAYA